MMRLVQAFTAGSNSAMAHTLVLQPPLGGSRQFSSSTGSLQRLVQAAEGGWVCLRTTTTKQSIAPTTPLPTTSSLPAQGMVRRPYADSLQHTPAHAVTSHRSRAQHTPPASELPELAPADVRLAPVRTARRAVVCGRVEVAGVRGALDLS